MQSTTVQTLSQQKAQLRIEIRRQLMEMPLAQMRQSDQQLFERFLALPEVVEAKMILLFWGVTGLEPDTAQLMPRLIAAGKRICMPRTLPQRQMETRLYQPGDPYTRTSYGVMEPDISCPLIQREEIDLALVPGMCYDRAGYRLGFGGGYYDRWLAHYPGKTVGLCRSLILRDQLPIEEHDQPVEILVTEDETLRPG